MNNQNKKTIITYIATVTLILIILNVISRNWFYRWDLTDNKEHSLSSSSKTVIKKIDDYLNIKAYFSNDLPHQLASTKRFVQDKLEDYAAYSKGNIRFEFVSDDEKIKEEAAKSGIQPVQVQVLENDAFIVKQIFMGLELKFNDKKEIIPLIQQEKLEYDITTKIKKLVETDKITIGIASISNQTNIKNESISQMLNQRYNVQNINLNQAVAPNIKLLLINGVEDSLTTTELDNLSNFIDQGGDILLAQNRINADLTTQQATPINSNIFSLIESYGLTIKPNLILDQNCGKVNVQQNLGFIRIPVPMDYPFLPIIKKENFNNQISMVNGLESLRLMFASEISIIDSNYNSDLIINTLFKSSQRSNIIEEFFNLSPDPQQNPSFSQLNQKGKLVGVLAQKNSYNSADTSKIILVSDSKLMVDDGGGAAPENQVFIMNAADYLIGDKDLIDLRSREITNRPLLELEDSSRSRWKWFNIIFAAILVIGIGIIRFNREKSRAKILEEIYD